MTETGKKLRYAKLVRKKTGRMLCVPIDHGMQIGVLPGLEDPAKLIEMLADSGVDAIILNPGMLSRWGHLLAGGPAVILRLDQTTMWRTDGKLGYSDTHTRLVSTIEDSLTMGADAVITYLFTCNNDASQETKCMEICGQVASEARKWGMIHIIEAMAANGGFAKTQDPNLVSMNCRIAGEIGADIIKTDWCGKPAIKKIVNSSLAPVGIAGGKSLGSVKKVCTFAKNAIDSGAMGLFFGRNVFTHPDARNLISELSKIVHQS